MATVLFGVLVVTFLVAAVVCYRGRRRWLCAVLTVAALIMVQLAYWSNSEINEDDVNSGDAPQATITVQSP